MQGGRQGIRATTGLRCYRAAVAFTLVELLVVIGIIALLIAILMPTLSSARRAAQRTACAAKLQQILIAAQVHQLDHQGYYPLAGVLPGLSPADLDDAYSTRYDYLSAYAAQGYPLVPSPMQFSLARDMNYRQLAGSTNQGSLNAQNMDPLGLSRNFLCPSQAGSMSELVQDPWAYICFDPAIGVFELYVQGSYIFNEGVCGWGYPGLESYRLHGQASRVRQPGATMFAADGLMGDQTDGHVGGLFGGGNPGGSGLGTLYNADGVCPPITMADALVDNGFNKAGDSANFDLVRHRGKINIGFCDGHVESKDITVKSLASVFLLAP